MIVKKKHFMFLGIILVMAYLYYNILFDICLIAMVFLSSYCLGNLFKIKGTWITKIITQISLGLGLIGLMIYYILLLDIGYISVYVLLLGLPILLKYKCIIKIKISIKKLNSFMCTKKIFIFCLALVSLFYTIYASMPISKYDALTKHLPLTIYAANNNGWYTNVVESVVYGESMLMQYTFSTLFIKFNSVKALTLFNVVLFLQLFFISMLMIRSIYKKTNLLLFLLVFFTVPIFFEYATCFYLEILPLYFLFSAAITIVRFDYRSVWSNFPAIAFLFGCSLFTKLTTSYTVFVLGILAIILYFRYTIRKKINIAISLRRLLISGIIFAIPFVPSIIVMWCKVGNPFIPMYNGIFNSPYFPNYNFIDPYNDSPLQLNISSLFKMVFSTSQNIEMHDGGLGIFLLFSILIPIYCIFLRNRKYIIWGSLPFIMYLIASYFTYNIRYYMSIILIFLIVIFSFTNRLINNLPKNTRYAVLYLWAIFLIIPNISYIIKNYPLIDALKSNSSITKNLNNDIMKQVPKESKVLSLNDPFKGEFEGFYSSIMWHNSYNVDKIVNGELDLKQYILAFDYVLYQKNKAFDIKLDEMNELINNTSENNYIEKSYETNTHILYKVKTEPIQAELVQKQEFKEPKLSTTSNPVYELIQERKDYYIIKQDIDNRDINAATIRFQINWHNSNNSFISTNIYTYVQETGRKVAESQIIARPKDASYGILYLTTHNNESVYVFGYELSGFNKQSDYLSEEKIKLSTWK